MSLTINFHTQGDEGKQRDFNIVTDHPDLVLKEGVRLSVDGRKLKVVKWDYQVIKKEDGSSIDVTVTVCEDKTSLVQRWYATLDPKKQFNIALFSEVILLVILVLTIWGGYWLVRDYPHPLQFWMWVGRYVRIIVVVSLALLTILPAPWVSQRFDESPFTKNLLLGLCSISLLAVVISWWIVSAPSRPFTGVQEEYVMYLNDLMSRFRTGAPLLISIIPWVVVILNYAGFKLVTEVLKLFAKRWEKKNP